MAHTRIASFLMAFICTTAAHAGPLTPPAGPVTSTGKTLTEVEPRIAINAANTPGDANSVFMIIAPGSYYLVGNVTGQSGKHGIEINAPDVTIDLNGFNLTGVAGSLNGIHWNSGVSLRVQNGAVNNWDGHGINGLGTNAPLLARRIVSHNNEGTGIIGGAASIIVECSAFTNTLNGIDVSTGSRVQDCIVQGGDGDGIVAAARCIVTGCAVSNVMGDGIQASNNCLVTNNNACFNGNGGDGAGIHVVGSDARIEGNAANNNDRGIDVDTVGSLIIRNSASGNTTNYSIVASNAVGPVVLAPGSPVISGSTGGSSVGSSDPWANISY